MKDIRANEILDKVRAETSKLSKVEASQVLAQALSKSKKTVAHVESASVKKNVKDNTAKRDIKDYLVIVDDENKLTHYEHRAYLKSSYNSHDTVAHNECERALTTFYRDSSNNLQRYDSETALKLLKEYIARVFKKTAQKDFFTINEVNLHYRVFGPSTTDNTRAACRKLEQSKIVKLEAVMCSDVSKRVKYYKVHVLKQ